jgi:AcrR family transcriptional regulator
MGTMATGTRERIVDAAAELLRERGYAGTGLKAISTKAPAPFGSLYHFFPGGKEELAAAALRHAAVGYARQVDAVLNEAGDDVVAAVRLGFDRAAELLVETDYADACPIATVALEVAASTRMRRAPSPRCSSPHSRAASCSAGALAIRPRCGTSAKRWQTPSRPH